MFGFQKEQEGGVRSRREWGLWIVLLLVFGGLVARLVYLQVFEGKRSSLLAQENRVKIERERAPRGVIYDREGEVLAKNVLDEKYGVTREYPLGKAGAHVVGYVSEVKEDELGCRRGFCYSQGMLIGREGVEKMFENRLRGEDGGRIVEVDSKGDVVREMGNVEPESGEDLKLSLDADLQKVMDEAIGERTGSVVALDMQGRVLGLVSKPAYDPNLFTVREDQSLLKNLLEDEESKYFLNRAVSGEYPPGSVFKLVTAYAGLESGEIDGETEIEDTGEIWIDDRWRYGNWYYDQYGKTEGFLNIVGALKRSNDIFFYKVGERVGVEKLADWARRFGLGEKTGVELPGKAKGLVPDSLWRERYIGDQWFLGNTYHMAIGQGDVLTTPLQIGQMSVAALSGRLCEVSVVGEGGVSCKDLGLDTGNIELVREGMRQACDDGGTAYPLFDFEPYVVCKTGTAQHGGEEAKPHAWITVGYPGENPEMVLVVMLESAGEGSEKAGPVAKEILEKWDRMR